MRKILFLWLLLGLNNSFGQIEEVRRITQTLCSPQFHGRGYVNRGDSIAAEFIASEFRKIGLKPLKGEYFQSFPLDVNTFPGAMSIQLNGAELKPGIDYLVDPGSAGGNYDLRPKWISISTALDPDALIREIKEILSEDYHNAVLFDFRNFGADTLKKVAGLTQAIAGIIPVIEVTNKKFTWSVEASQLAFPLIQVSDAVYSENPVLSIKIDSKLIKGYTSRNVFGYLPAKKKTKNTLIFSAHYDHLGRMGFNTYFPGGNDNASGTAMLISMAKYFKEHPSDYNILFIAFAGEEAGLVGSKYFVEHPKVKLKKINFMVNLDIMGSGEEGITVVNATLFKEQFELLQTINSDKQLLAAVKSRGPAANSDHYWFTEKGVPAFFIYTMGPNKNYHDVHDTYENLSFVEYQDITTLLVEFVERLK